MTGLLRRYYGFQFEDGEKTTRQRGNGEYFIAGALYSFPTRAARAEWVKAGVPYRVPRDAGVFRKAVAAGELPHGWTVKQAQPHGLSELEKFNWMARGEE